MAIAVVDVNGGESDAAVAGDDISTAPAAPNCRRR